MQTVPGAEATITAREHEPGRMLSALLTLPSTERDGCKTQSHIVQGAQGRPAASASLSDAQSRGYSVLNS